MEVPSRAAACAHHSDQPYSATCTHCGDYVCQRCIAFAVTSRELCVRCDPLISSSRYYPVPTWRFLVLSMASLGIYTYYWSYQCWKRIKRQDQSDLWPIVYGYFFMFSYFALVVDLNKQLIPRKRGTVSGLWPVVSLILLFVSRIASKYDQSLWAVGSLLLAPLCALPALMAMQEIASEQEMAERAAFRARHVLGFGICAFILLGVGLTVVPAAENTVQASEP